jgi:glucose/arabinose dehydrogenase
MPHVWFALVLGGVVGACAHGEGYNVGDPLPGDSGIAAVMIVDGLDSPLFLTAPPSDARLFLVERDGRIRIVRDGQLIPTPFLDITDLVATGGERGLLGLAFHPSYADNGVFFVNYSDRNGDTRIERYTVSEDADRADRESATLVLAIDQPYGNHNGGMIAFGPDGMLYVGMGDGGSANDPHGHGQNPQTLLGAMLRIDVDVQARPYGIPSGNPFAGRADGRDEIWALGLRNPWRFSFDRGGDRRLFIADVGQNAWEEIDVVDATPGGRNFGWRIMEGTHCLGMGTCDSEELTLPLVEYGHDEGCSVIGGYVYRGAAIPELGGHYFYSDWCSGWLRSFRIGDDGAVSDHTEWPVGDLGTVVSFGEDAAGELYVVSQTGVIYRLMPRQ